MSRNQRKQSSKLPQGSRPSQEERLTSFLMSGWNTCLIPEGWYCCTAKNTDDDEGAATDDKDTAQSRDQVVKYERIDVYWSKVGKMTRPTGERKFSAVMRLARIALTLNHGSADVERGFSKKKLLLTSHRMRLKCQPSMACVRFHPTSQGTVVNLKACLSPEM
ncbi:hypothetical protein HOLleu_42647 [Holothuria leucospilota]|uniref:HAT C-terminal dimerisation domain-containing protein n=1 Tax=Holothuria leucospilota TaxID=206669 RepID=A0A9Q1BC21_HOLLE|nr:hypothetical protein HOLleu_42647 [Holothuria leucospilota]